ncbi:hypothetical protein F2Q70_00000885 [Brassica cretica]|uniref:Uncharacterized protein n=1 Tax=Brassica cretica TaxID=69181 RepID=A0A8S9ILD7_BRACR|nr:hypothetical protein F2Q70_00000885 [Brassica cretica]
MISLKSLSSTLYQIKRCVLSSLRLSVSCGLRVMSSWAIRFLCIHWFIRRLWSLNQICDEFIFSLIGEAIFSIITECDLPTNKTWWLCVVDVFMWLAKHNGFTPPKNFMRRMQVLWNKKRNLKPPWPWGRLQTSCSFTMVTPLLQRNMFYLIYGVMKATLVFSFIKIVTLVNQILFYVLRTTRGTRDCLYEDMERKTMKLRTYQCQFEELCMVWIWNTTKHVVSCSGSVWNGQRCNRWILPPDLLSDKRRWITMDDSRTQDHIRPRTTIEKLANQSILQSELGSIVLLFFYYHVQLKNVLVVSCSATFVRPFNPSSSPLEFISNPYRSSDPFIGRITILLDVF